MSKIKTVLAMALASTSLLLACAEPQDTSEGLGVQEIDTNGEMPAMGEHVLIYYANETRPEGEELENYKYITGLMRQVGHRYVVEAAERMERDTVDFALAVDREIANFDQQICRNAANKTLNLVVFDNQHARHGQVRYCRAGGIAEAGAQGLVGLEDPKLAELIGRPEFASDYRLAANPLAHPESFRLMLGTVSRLFNPSRYTYTLITKSHGSVANAMGIRLATRGEVLRKTPHGEEIFKAHLLISAQARVGALANFISGKAGSEATGRRVANETSQESAPQLKEGLLKEALLKEGLLKEALLKEGVLKEGVLKEALLKEGVLASEDAQTKDLLGEASLPAIGVSKGQYFSTLARQTEISLKQRPMFTTVFVESCNSNPSLQDLEQLNQGGQVNVMTLFVSDAGGIPSYNLLNYEDMFAKFDWRGNPAMQIAFHIKSKVRGK